MVNNAIYLCQLNEIEDPGSKGFVAVEGQAPFFVIRCDRGVFAYLNSCPHYGAPLDWKPDAFLSYEKDSILCSMHGALFNLDRGICINGPCLGKGLTPVSVGTEEGSIYLYR
ncbi:MAG: Rieske (2Fe-2S) protein [Pseudomonadota bacterium]|nr:Rieske (2Fe-2S) protein [Pseudomonadota bacterium]